MAGLKRKDMPVRLGSQTTTKKPKPTPKILLETEPDSDPIIESDTTEHSGDDDGVSWPSDDESQGGIALPARTQKEPAKAPPAQSKKQPTASAKKSSSVPPKKQPIAAKPGSKVPQTAPKATSEGET